MRVVLGVLLWLLCGVASAKPSEEDCGAYTLMREAVGEEIKVQRAVVDVLLNRKRKYGKSLCRVVKMPHQFPYWRYGIKPVAFGMKIRYNAVLRMKRVLPDDYVYFGTVKSPWSRDTIRLGNLYFSR